MPELVDFIPELSAEVARIWNAACGPSLAISEDGVRYNTEPPTGARQAGRLALIDREPAGFVLATAFTRGDAAVSPPDLGWVEAVAVLPAYQHRGLGTELMDWAEGWLAASGCRRFRLGAGLRPFAPGLPSELPAGFFRARGYNNRSTGSVVWDVARDMRDYHSPATIDPQKMRLIRAATPGDEPALDRFFTQVFPGRWAYEHQEFLLRGGRISDFTVVDLGGRIEGFCWLTFTDSARSLERCFMNDLPKPWGHLGPIGVSETIRGNGWGGALLDAGLRRLRDAGAAGCVIDWTDLLDFYGKFGFEPFRSYQMLVKAAA